MTQAPDSRASRRRRFRRWAWLTASLLVAFALLFYALRSDSELDALRADPFARWSPGAQLGVSVEADEEGLPSVELYGSVPGLGDREGAIYVRTFLVPRADALKPFEAARRAAQNAGWRLDYPDYITANSPRERTWTAVRGDKELPTGTAIVYITLDTAPVLRGSSVATPTDANRLTVMLEHTR